MKIGLDLRFVSDDLYSSFVIELTKGIIKNSPTNSFTIYTNKELEGFNFINCSIKNIGIKNNSFKEQFLLNTIFKNDKNTLMLFFNHYKPLGYKGEYITLVHSLKDIYYNNYSNYFHKYIFLYLLEKNLNRSNKLICFDQKTSEELTEKFNIKEDKINIITGFFPNKVLLSSVENIKIPIKTKYDLKNNFYIYSGGEGVEKNYEKLIHVFHKLKKEGQNIDLVLLGRNITKNISLRKLILDLQMQKNIHFISVIKQNEKILFYKNALGVIFPSFYEPFPFKLTEPLYYNTSIIASDLNNIKSIFNESIDYFSPISVNSIYESIKNNLIKPRTIINYNEIKRNYSKEKTITQILDIIN